MNLKNIVILSSLVAFPFLLYAEMYSEYNQVANVEGENGHASVSIDTSGDSVGVKKNVESGKVHGESTNTLYKGENGVTVEKNVYINNHETGETKDKSVSVTVDPKVAAKNKINKNQSKVAANKNK